MSQLPPDDQPSGKGLVPADGDDAIAQAIRENPPGGPWMTGIMFHYAVVDEGGAEVDKLRRLVTPESLAAWGNFSSTRALLMGTGWTTRADEPAPGVAYVKFTPSDMPTVRVDGDVAINVRAVATLQYRPELGGWRVHHVGEPCLPEDLPPLP